MRRPLRRLCRVARVRGRGSGRQLDTLRRISSPSKGRGLFSRHLGLHWSPALSRISMHHWWGGSSRSCARPCPFAQHSWLFGGALRMHASRPRGLDPSGSARTQVDTCHCSANRLLEHYSDIRRSYRSAHLSERSGKPRPQRRHTCTWRSRTLTLMRYAACTAECMPTRAIGDILRSKRSDTVWPDEPLGRLSNYLRRDKRCRRRNQSKAQASLSSARKLAERLS